jgi:hypothetical protein
MNESTIGVSLVQAVSKYLGAEGIEEKKICLALAKECPREAAEIAALMTK